MVDENNNTKSKLSSNMPLKEAKKYTTQIQKIMHILFINSFDSNLNFITQQQIKDDTTIINKNIKYRDEILNYLISIKVLEKGGDSFFITKKFIIFLKDLKQFIESKQIFENVNSKGVSKEPIEFNSNTSTEISEFLVLLQTHFGCFQVIENNIHLNTKFSHTRSFLSFYYLINYSFAMQHCTQYIVNIGIIK
ncbi:MAG: hypothetical protein LAT82_04910 [Nanoarchaeota archaeon]|nr:hypothetical protein [Nanoarchaeota archaeon]